ncbi:C1 family peptidase [Patiriisocius hiemis]|uniref:C1 family peptidase n=1 Tax=Patiriisocius hiemis TaxID=3075604 RepID=A0ABU2YCE7_9FLAO|nr:C1 family peptidase [Constantimarinum sp. W242]MDT0555864.1 C1 family peptidase [Constantimarinum sp. W242]
MRALTFLAVLLLTTTLVAQDYPTGMIWDEEVYRSIPYKAQFTASTYDNLPTSYSLEEYAPIPGNQGRYGTCVAYASAYGLRTIMLAKDRGMKDKQTITSNALSPSYVYAIIKREDDINCDKGANPKLGLEALKVAGAPTLKSLPYACNPSISTSVQLEAIDYRIRDYQTLFFFDAQQPGVKTNATKKALSEGYPILLGMKLPESFFKAKKVWRSVAADKGTMAKKHGYHAMVVVGYDDNYEGGAFRVLNSWGTNWGDEGYIWVPYKEYEEWAMGALQPYSYHKKKEDDNKPKVIPVKPNKPGKPSLPDNTPDEEPIAGKLPKGSLRFETNQGQPMEVSRISTRNLVVEDDVKTEKEDLVAYRMTQGYPSGTRFRFYLKNENEGYIYAFATDLTQKINKILPYSDGMSPLIGANSEIAFPSESKVIKMDDNPGTDYLLILFSQQELNEKELLQKMQSTSGGLTSKIKSALGDKLIDKSMVKYASGTPGFEVKNGANGYVVPVMVEISHQ